MAAELYETILQELGELMEMELKPDVNQTCLIRLKPGLEVYFEMDKKDQWFVMGCILGTIPPGTYRQSLFTEALKMNGLPPPYTGVFAYNSPAQTLVFYRFFLAEQLKGEEVFTAIPAFTKVSLAWKEAIDQGNIPDTGIAPEAETTPHSGMFGLG